MLECQIYREENNLKFYLGSTNKVDQSSQRGVSQRVRAVTSFLSRLKAEEKLATYFAHALVRESYRYLSFHIK